MINIRVEIARKQSYLNNLLTTYAVQHDPQAQQALYKVNPEYRKLRKALDKLQRKLDRIDRGESVGI